LLSNAWLILLFPLLGFLYSSLIGRVVSRRSCGIVASLAIGASFVAGLIALSEMLALPEESRAIEIQLYTWIAAGNLSVPFSILLDPLSMVMVLVITGVGFLIHVYATGYMQGDTGYARFFAYMNLFVLAMLMLVLAGNFVQLIVGWGGVGFSSYALISFWFHESKNAAAGTKAFVVNSVGDIGLILATFLIFVRFGRLDYTGVFSGVSRTLDFNGGYVTAIALLLLLGAAAKSAQFPLHIWLPDAMAGPTPVSALIHAATMVTAGVYLIARMHPIFLMSPTAMAAVAVVGAFTALFAATIGLVQPNIKRVLAYSTVSQLGYMFLAVGVGAFTAGMFHLITHAFFKAVLFLSAGGVIHALGGEENLNKMGGLRKALPVMYWSFLLGALANVGFPLTSGFFSKDEILLSAFASERGSQVLGAMALVSVVFTGFYVFRAFFMAFHGESHVDPHHHIHKPGAAMSLPVALLGILAAVGGGLQFLAGPGTIDRFLEPVFTRYARPVPMVVEADAMQEPLMFFSVVLGLAGIALAFVMYVRQPKLAAVVGGWYPGLYKLLLNKYWVDEAYGLLIVRPGLWTGRFFSNVFDPAVTDGLIGVFTGAIRGTSLGLRRLQSGYIRDYALAVMAGAVVIVFYLLQVGGTR
jgi:NADH-quinone oxidoreductase subunit L